MTNNTSADFGGGISTYAMRAGAGALVVDTLVAGNTCGNRGGGVSGGLGLVLDGCIVSNNVATRGGGVFGLNYTARDCTFADNTATYIGGGLSALDAASGDSVLCVGCHVVGNLATNVAKNASGGGIYDNKGVVRLESCTLAGNISNTGGGIYGGTNMVSTVVSNNCATTGSGGGTYFLGVASVERSTIVSNRAEVGNGGGMCTTANKPVAVSGSTIAFNYAGSNGGGAYAPSATFTNTTISSNRSVLHGAGIYGSQTASQRPVLRGCTVVDNAAGVNKSSAANGGGLWGAVAYDTEISGNSTFGTGAGARDCVLARCTLSGNTAADIGGSVSCFGGGAYGGFATNCVFSGNTALRQGTRNDSGGGGGMYGVSGVGNVLFGNEARLGAGAFLVSGNMLANCVVSNNVATSSGGGAYGAGSVYNSLVVDNGISNATGGAAAAGAAGTSASSLVLVNCTVACNDGGAARGGLYQVAVTNTISWGNSGLDDANVSPAVSSCSSILTEGVNNNINSNPKLDDRYALRRGSPCVNAATEFGWMTDANDARSRDVFGNARVNAAPDMGAAEFYPARGMAVLFR